MNDELDLSSFLQYPIQALIPKAWNSGRLNFFPLFTLLRRGGARIQIQVYLIPKFTFWVLAHLGRQLRGFMGKGRYIGGKI